LKYLKQRFPDTESLQIDRGDGEDLLDKDGIRLLPATKFLAQLV
jgi:hypothetical protein